MSSASSPARSRWVSGCRELTRDADSATSSTVRSIGVRQLRQDASKHLRAVQGGETVEVTDRGRPVALIVPIPRQGRLEALEASGLLVRGTGDLLELGAPLRPRKGVPLPSAILAAMRAEER